MTVADDGMAVPVARAPSWPSRWWAGPWGRQLGVQLLLIVGGYLAYKQVRTLARDQAAEAFDNAARVIRLEKAVGMFTEMDLQRLVLDSTTLVEALNRYYATVHFPATVAVVVWAYARRRTTVYPELRFLLLSTSAAGLAIHVAFPLAPPRMLPGFVDTLLRYGPSVYPSDPGESIANQFAAMPSLHFAWAVLIAWCVAGAVRHRGVRALLWAHPAITLLAITATANHYWLDSIVGGALVAGAVVLRRWVLAPRPADLELPGAISSA